MKGRSSQQQPVISIRISEELRERLEKLKQMMALKTGQAVSTSEAAKQLLDSARDDRIEAVGLLLEPTESLLNVRKKLEARLTLSQAEWTLVAYYCTQGAEAFTSTEQGLISHETLAALLEAFLAAYETPRRKSRVALDWTYLQTLPADGKQARDKDPEQATRDDVRRVVKRTIEMLRDPDANKRRRPILAVRNLYTMLDDEKFINAEKLNDALWPHWRTLWKLCARGHYAMHKKPLRDRPQSEDEDEDFEEPILYGLPTFEERGYRLELPREEGNDFTPRIGFPGPLKPHFPLLGYPRIAEFRRMLELLDLAPAMSQWKGHYYVAWTGLLDNDERAVTLFSRDSGIRFSFPMDDWKVLQNLFRRAWQSPEVAAAWDILSDEYGEL
jgi:hypothetical protein